MRNATASLLSSMGGLAVGIAQRWVAFLPAGALGLLSMGGVQVDVRVTAAVLGLGLLWAVVTTYHHLRAQYLGLLDVSTRLLREVPITQDALARMAAEGTRLLGEINAYQPASLTEGGHGHQWEAEKWVGRCIDVLNWRLPHLTASLANDAGRDTSDFRGIAWKHHLVTWMNVRLERIHELVLDADRYQRGLGSPPDWWETDPPNTCEWP